MLLLGITTAGMARMVGLSTSSSMGEGEQVKAVILRMTMAGAKLTDQVLVLLQLAAAMHMVVAAVTCQHLQQQLTHMSPAQVLLVVVVAAPELVVVVVLLLTVSCVLP